MAGKRIIDIEQIDLTGAGDNSLVTRVIDVLNLSSHSNTLVIRRDLGDIVDIGDGWRQVDVVLVHIARVRQVV